MPGPLTFQADGSPAQRGDQESNDVSGLDEQYLARPLYR